MWFDLLGLMLNICSCLIVYLVVGYFVVWLACCFCCWNVALICMPAVMLTEALCWILLLLCCVALVVGWTADYC